MAGEYQERIPVYDIVGRYQVVVDSKNSAEIATLVFGNRTVGWRFTDWEEGVFRITRPSEGCTIPVPIEALNGDDIAKTLRNIRIALSKERVQPLEGILQEGDQLIGQMLRDFKLAGVETR